MKVTFIAVIDDGSVIEKGTIEELSNYNFASLFFKKEVHSSQTSGFSPFITYYSYSYTPIDILGNKITLKIGDLTLIEIGPDKIHYQTFLKRPIRFFDKKTKDIREIISKNKTTKFLFDDVKLNIDILKKVKDWDIFIKLKNYDLLEMENEKLKQAKKKLEDKLLKFQNLNTEKNSA